MLRKPSTNLCVSLYVTFPPIFVRLRLTQPFQPTFVRLTKTFNQPSFGLRRNSTNLRLSHVTALSPPPQLSVQAVHRRGGVRVAVREWLVRFHRRHEVPEELRVPSQRLHRRQQDVQVRRQGKKQNIKGRKWNNCRCVSRLLIVVELLCVHKGEGITGCVLGFAWLYARFPHHVEPTSRGCVWNDVWSPKRAKPPENMYDGDKATRREDIQNDPQRPSHDTYFYCNQATNSSLREHSSPTYGGIVPCRTEPADCTFDTIPPC